jgi:hypothetical protein
MKNYHETESSWSLGQQWNEEQDSRLPVGYQHSSASVNNLNRKNKNNGDNAHSPPRRLL